MSATVEQQHQQIVEAGTDDLQFWSFSDTQTVSTLRASRSGRFKSRLILEVKR